MYQVVGFIIIRSRCGVELQVPFLLRYDPVYPFVKTTDEDQRKEMS